MAKPLPVSSRSRADECDAEVFGEMGMSEKHIDCDSLWRKIEEMAGNKRLDRFAGAQTPGRLSSQGRRPYECRFGGGEKAFWKG